LFAHHTTKLSKGSWEQMDFTYSGIGGGEVANVQEENHQSPILQSPIEVFGRGTMASSTTRPH
jgi:hypothetical protein